MPDIMHQADLGILEYIIDAIRAQCTDTERELGKRKRYDTAMLRAISTGTRIVSRSSWKLVVMPRRPTLPFVEPVAPDSVRDAAFNTQLGGDLQQLRCALDAAPGCKGSNVHVIQHLKQQGVKLGKKKKKKQARMKDLLAQGDDTTGPSNSPTNEVTLASAAEPTLATMTAVAPTAVIDRAAPTVPSPLTASAGTAAVAKTAVSTAGPMSTEPTPAVTNL
ncbi:unnamed protein product [Closterium sp. NIES-54]